MRVLVTGHQGYLGTVKVPVLQTAGHGLTGLDSGFRRGKVMITFGAARQED
jgi:nucleoside-diphosphate-sugar epimerase